MKFTTTLIAILTITVIQLSAQNVWTLEKCINYAHQNNIQIKLQELNSTIAENNLNQSYYNFLPNVNGFATHEKSWGKTFSYDKLQYVDQNYFDGYFGVSSSLDIFNGLNNIYTLKQNKYKYLSNQAQVEKVKNDISLEIALAYLQILFNQELLENTNNQIEVTKQQRERTKKMVDAGSLAKGSLLEIKAQYASEVVNITNAQNNLNISYINIIQLLDLDSVGSFAIQKPIDLDVNIDKQLNTLSSIYDKAVTIMPEIKSAELNVQTSELSVKMEQMAQIPSLSLDGVFYTRYSEIAIGPEPENYDTDLTNDIAYDYGNQIKDFAYRKIELNLSIPIFNRLSQRTKIQNSQIDLLNSELLLEQQKQNLYKVIQQAQADATAALQDYISNLEAVNSMEEAFRYTQQKFDVGMVNSVDYNIAKNNLAKSESELLQAKYTYLFKTKILDFYMGNPIVI